MLLKNGIEINTYTDDDILAKIPKYGSWRWGIWVPEVLYTALFPRALCVESSGFLIRWPIYQESL